MHTSDNFLGGKLKILQPQRGYRAGSDAVFLAAFLPAGLKGKVLDVGCGVGTVSLCGAYRLPEAEFVGIDCQADIIKLAEQNAHLNGLAQRTQFMATSFEKSTLPPGTFHHVVTNPPYFDSSAVSPQVERALARSQINMTLEGWMKFCIKMARPRGYISLIYPAAYLPQALQSMRDLGEIIVFPLWPKQGQMASRCLIRGRKDVRSANTFRSGLILHQATGEYTAEAHAVLWEGSGLLL